MTVRRSDDSAVTWPYALRVDPGDGAYSCLVDGELIVGEKKEEACCMRPEAMNCGLCAFRWR